MKFQFLSWRFDLDCICIFKSSFLLFLWLHYQSNQSKKSFSIILCPYNFLTHFPFLPMFTFLSPQNIIKLVKFSIVFRGYSNVTLEINGGLIVLYIYIYIYIYYIYIIYVIYIIYIYIYIYIYSYLAQVDKVKVRHLQWIRIPMSCSINPFFNVFFLYPQKLKWSENLFWSFQGV